MAVSTKALETQLRKAAEREREATEKRDDLIRRLRDEGLSLRDLGELAGLSHTAIANICRAEPDAA